MVRLQIEMLLNWLRCVTLELGNHVIQTLSLSTFFLIFVLHLFGGGHVGLASGYEPREENRSYLN
jgi:hypothetical protein